MKTAVRVVLGVAIATATWLAITVSSVEVLHVIDRQESSERLLPYRNAHLLEAASERAYSPATDPLFVLVAASRAALSFMGAVLLVSRSLPVGSRSTLATVIGALGIGALILFQRATLAPGIPGGFKMALLLEALSIVIGARAGYMLGHHLPFGTTSK